MVKTFNKALDISAALVIIAVAAFISYGDTCYGKPQTFAKEAEPMAISQSRSTLPPIDTAQPEKFETATFALG